MTGFSTEIPPQASIDAANELRDKLRPYDIFTSEKDLENDLLNQGLEAGILSHLDVDDKHEALKLMQKRKATFMFNFLQKQSGLLKTLEKSELAKPLFACKNLLKRMYEANSTARENN